MSSTIDGKQTKPMPASVTAAMKRGTPQRVVLATGPKPKSSVKVK